MQEVIYNEDTLIRVKEGRVTIYRVHPTDSVKATLRELSEQHGFDYQTEWNTRNFGATRIDGTAVPLKYFLQLVL